MGFARISTKARGRDGLPVASNHDPFFVMPSAAGFPYRDNWSIERATQMALNRNPWVFRAIQAIANNQAKLPMVVRQDNWVDGKIIDSEVTDLLNYRSNPTTKHQNASMFRKRISQILLLNRSGCFIEMIRTRGGDLAAMQILPPGYTTPIPDPKTYVSGFRVEFPGKQFVDVDPDNVLWLREPHPTDEYSGITPLEAAGMSVEMDYYSRLYNLKFLQNDMRPGGILVAKGKLDPKSLEELRRRFSGGGYGYSGAGRLTALQAEGANAGVDFVDTAVTPRDGHYLMLDKQTRETTLLAFGVPESIIGNASGRTWDNADAEKGIFWEETMLGGHLETIARGFDDAIDPDPKHFVGYDFSRVPVLQRALMAKRKEMRDEVLAGVRTVDEYRTGVTDLPEIGATKLYRPGTIVPTIDTQYPNEPLDNAGGGGAVDSPFGQLPAPADPTSGYDQYAADQTDQGVDPSQLQAASLPAGQAKADGPAQHTSVMVAVPISKQVADAVGSTEDPPHITLAYLGDQNDVDQGALLAAMASFSFDPLEGEVGGIGMFPAGPDGTIPVWAPADIPGLSGLRERLVQHLSDHGINPSADTHGFTPHMTLRYQKPGESIPDPVAPQKVTVDQLLVAHAGSHTLFGAGQVKVLVPRRHLPARQPAGLW